MILQVNLQDVFPLILMAGALGFLFFTQWRRTQKQKELVNAVAEGDEVILLSGIHGFVGSVDQDVIWLEVAEGTEIKVARSAIQGVVGS